MYICLECGEIFESPKRIIDEEYYGCYQYDYVCPYCGGDYVEVVECLGCGKNFGEEDLTEGFCKKCEKEIQDKVGYEKYDIVVANILADVLVPLTPVILHQLKPGGIYITSGIIDDKEETVVNCVKEAGLEVLEVTYQGEWVSVTARKN